LQVSYSSNACGKMFPYDILLSITLDVLERSSSPYDTLALLYWEHILSSLKGVDYEIIGSD